jgi:hypothetical protein
MVIHVRSTDEASSTALLQHFVENRNGRDLYLGKRLLGWSVSDAIVIRSEALPSSLVQKYVRHFAAQRHVLFSRRFTPVAANPYLALAHELRNYMFALLDPFAADAQTFQARLKTHIKSPACEIVTLAPARGVHQLEVLLMSAPRVLRSDEPLELPELSAVLSAGGVLRKTLKAA